MLLRMTLCGAVGVMMVFVSFGQESDRSGNEAFLPELIKEASSEVGKVLPGISVEAQQHGFDIGYKTRPYEVYGSDARGEWRDNLEKTVGPKLDGFLFKIRIGEGERVGPLRRHPSPCFSTDKAIPLPYFFGSFCIRRFKTHFVVLNIYFGAGADAKVMDGVFAKVAGILDGKFGPPVQSGKDPVPSDQPPKGLSD